MPLRGPNHARALFWGLSLTWLYAVSVLWYCGATGRPFHPVSLAQGSLSLSLLVYGVAVLHRGFLVNGLPFLAALLDLLTTVPKGLGLFLEVVSSLVLLVSSLVVLWATYHARRDAITWRASLPLACVCATPILVYEVGVRLLGVDFYELIVSAILSRPS